MRSLSFIARSLVVVLLLVIVFLSGMLHRQQVGAQGPPQSWVIYVGEQATVTKIQDGTCSLYISESKSMAHESSFMVAGQGCR